ncbi:uncharacterized protein TRAVEDRAFT_53930 [Trametes versicolor FP-101664 SS1]|uniref:BTB domain-containing protein n=1 Tax=Trametes versicolor (strain FP-101664) TaxID=717944 RepID=R7S8B3_TRAVS|nr:uncharacterized protein TRAVEDRAFT_53930 [Trametes versicolor FP-101664 SS1]EIW51935.1 hypothetical protein TRAVEDRAFT_53930 [Trametes versicolor FP-101664 SS1]
MSSGSAQSDSSSDESASSESELDDTHDQPANASPTAQSTTRHKRKASVSHVDDSSEPTKVKKVKQEETEDTVAHLNIDDIPVVIHDDLWYPDGNVILLVEGSAFKLYKARLARYSSVLDVLFKEDGKQVAEYENSPCYRLSDIAYNDFIVFLEVLETPFKYTNVFPQQDAAVSILKVSRLLDCSMARDLALSMLRKLWPDDRPLLAVPSKCKYSDALVVLKASRDYAVPSLRKRAFYELLRSAAFWKAVADDRRALGLADADVFALFGAREALQQQCSTLIFKRPSRGSDWCPMRFAEGNRCNPPYKKPHLRKAFWRSDVIQSGDYESGMRDPIGWLGVMMNKHDTLTGQGWCEMCFQERRTAWMGARTSWWAMLDKWFDLA